MLRYTLPDGGILDVGTAEKTSDRTLGEILPGLCFRGNALFCRFTNLDEVEKVLLSGNLVKIEPFYTEEDARTFRSQFPQYVGMKLHFTEYFKNGELTETYYFAQLQILKTDTVNGEKRIEKFIEVVRKMQE